MGSGKELVQLQKVTMVNGRRRITPITVPRTPISISGKSISKLGSISGKSISKLSAFSNTQAKISTSNLLPPKNCPNQSKSSNLVSTSQSLPIIQSATSAQSNSS